MFRLCRNANPRATSMATCRPLHHCIAQSSRAQEFRVLVQQVESASRAVAKHCSSLASGIGTHSCTALKRIARQRVPSGHVASRPKIQDIKVRSLAANNLPVCREAGTCYARTRGR